MLSRWQSRKMQLLATVGDLYERGVDPPYSLEQISNCAKRLGYGIPRLTDRPKMGSHFECCHLDLLDLLEVEGSIVLVKDGWGRTFIYPGSHNIPIEEKRQLGG